LPLLVGSVIAHAFTVLTLKRSILTEKIARRGYHLSREYAVDPLELLYVREVMQDHPSAVLETGQDDRHLSASPDEPLRAVVYRMAEHGVTQLPVVEAETSKILGTVSLEDLLKARTRHLEEERRRERTLGFGTLSLN